MKIILTFFLFVLTTTKLISAPGYYDQIDVISNSSGNICISKQSNEFKLEADKGNNENVLADKNEISSINGSFINFQSLERGRRILEKKYNLYT